MQQQLIEYEVLDGLKPIALAEIKRKYPSADFNITKNRAAIQFQFSGKLDSLSDIKTIVAAHVLHPFAVPRPKAFLGHQHFTHLMNQINQIIQLYPANTYSTFTISAAGKDSSTFQRLRDEIGKALELQYHPEEADLLLRFRPSKLEKNGWDFMIRVGPRPYSARPWRVFNMEGALNGSVAAAIVELTNPQPQDQFLNLMSGSGTLLIERLQYGPSSNTVGVEINNNIIQGAIQNFSATNLKYTPTLIQADAIGTPFSPNTFNVITADLPWGQLMGSNKENERLYPALFKETARIASPKAKMILLTHSIKLMDKTMFKNAADWKLQQEIKIKQGGLHRKSVV